MFVVRFSCFLASGVGSRVVRFRCESRSSVARLLWRLRAARRWWWKEPRFGSRSFVAPPPGSLRSLWRFFSLGGVFRVGVWRVGSAGAGWSVRVPRRRRVRR